MALAFGFYGKLPSQGDFVSRRLPWDFTEAWDAWLQAGLAQVKAERGPRWLDDYLTAPVWRFALAPGLAGPSGWLGLWFPSVDRVGRHFPMTVAAALAPGQPAPQLVAPDDAWLALEDQALLALDPATTLDRYDTALQQLALQPVALQAEAPSMPCVQPLPVEADAAAAQREAEALGAAPVRFFTWGSDTVVPALVQAAGWPAAGRFGGFVHGRWPDTDGKP